MSSESEKVVEGAHGAASTVAGQNVRHELAHLRSSWCWIVSLGVFLVLCGATAIGYPAITSLAAINVLGVLLVVGGIVTIVGSFWAGKWSGFLVQLLVGFLYVAAGIAASERPVVTVVMVAFFLAVSFMVLGAFRAMGALIIRFPQWGWALLNGVITFLCGMVIYRHLPVNAFWVIGLLVGLEMLLHGWTWIMLGLALRKLPQEAS